MGARLRAARSVGEWDRSRSAAAAGAQEPASVSRTRGAGRTARAAAGADAERCPPFSVNTTAGSANRVSWEEALSRPFAVAVRAQQLPRGFGGRTRQGWLSARTPRRFNSMPLPSGKARHPRSRVERQALDELTRSLSTAMDICNSGAGDDALRLLAATSRKSASASAQPGQRAHAEPSPRKQRRQPTVALLRATACLWHWPQLQRRPARRALRRGRHRSAPLWRAAAV